MRKSVVYQTGVNAQLAAHYETCIQEMKKKKKRSNRNTHSTHDYMNCHIQVGATLRGWGYPAGALGWDFRDRDGRGWDGLLTGMVISAWITWVGIGNR